MRTQSVSSARRARMAGGDRGLQHVWPDGAAGRLGTVERGESAPDQQPVPAAPVLLLDQDRFAVGVASRAQARSLDLEQRLQAVRLRLVRTRGASSESL
jgi:hypothetical protein